MASLALLVKDFYGNDPIRGEDACQELFKLNPQEVIEALVPVDRSYEWSTQVEIRFKKLASAFGNQILPNLVQVISSGPWFSKQLASPCFAGLQCSAETESPLIDILKSDSPNDSKRLAIEALGYLGADGWDHDLVRFAKSGVWNDEYNDSDSISRYHFDKFSSYVLEALARFAARSTDRDDAKLRIGRLTGFIELRQAQMSHVVPDGYDLVARNSHLFTEWSVDPLIDLWGFNSDNGLQLVCMEVLRHIAPLRAAKFLLESAISPMASEFVRESASVALGEIRVPQVARRLVNSLGDPATDRTHLDWAFSSLDAVSDDGSDLDAYRDELLLYKSEPAAQLRYSLALKGDSRCQADLIERLDAPDPFNRWAAALALARLMGPKSRSYLEHRAEDAGHPVERCAMYAAMIRAGDHSKAKDLHEALQLASTLPQLKSIWKLEILDAFRCVGTFDTRAFSLWQEAARISRRQQQYFDAITIISSGSPGPSLVTRNVAPPSRTPTKRTVNKKDVRIADPITKPLTTSQIGKHHKIKKPIDIRLLIDKLPTIQSGKASADDYHNYIIEAVEAIFSPNLTRPKKEEIINNGRKRIDITFSNEATDGFFNRIRNHKHVTSLYVIIECKNYTDDPQNPEIDQLAGRFNPQRGNFGILICRRIKDRSLLLHRCKDFLQDNKFLLTLDDDDLLQLMEFGKNEDRRAISDYMDDLFKKLVM